MVPRRPRFFGTHYLNLINILKIYVFLRRVIAYFNALDVGYIVKRKKLKESTGTTKLYPIVKARSDLPKL